MRITSLPTFLIATLLVFGLSKPAHAQSQTSNTSKEMIFLWSYHLPEKYSDGPMDIQVHGTYHFVREKFAGKTIVSIRYNITRLLHTPEFGTLRFKLRNKVYKQNVIDATDGLGVQGFDNLKITSINVRMRAIGLKNARDFNIDSFFNYQSEIGEIDENTDLNRISLSYGTSYVTALGYDDSTELRTRIDQMNTLVVNRDKYKQLLVEADRLFNSDNWSDAKSKYQQASQLFPDENYPKDQLLKIKSKEQQIKTDNDNKATENPKPDSSSASIGSSNSVSSAGVSNVERTTSNNSTGSGKTNMSEKVKNQNGEDIQVFQENGKSYVQHTNGTTREITQESYQSISNAAIANATAQKNYEDAVAKENKRVSDINAARKASYQAEKEQRDVIYNAANGIINSFYEAAKEKEQQEREDRAEKLKIAEEEARREREIKLQKEKLISSRKALLAKYPEGKTPLSYQAKDNKEIYFFAYSYKPASVENETSEFYISNVFPIAKYADDTWPFKTNIIEDIARTNKGLSITLSGFYENEQEAVRANEEFKEEAANCIITLKRMDYSGKKSTASSSGNSDFWGNSETKNKMETTNKNATDFWGNAIPASDNKPSDNKPMKSIAKKAAASPARKNKK